MPKQRGRPHHHSTRAAHEPGLQLPTIGTFEARNPLNPTPFTYPKGWVLRPWYRSRSWPVRIFMLLWTAAIVAGLLMMLASKLGIGR